ncbi:hypothetical protein [Streptomyces sp. NPDC021224]|uniref:hypothetical protein n=1 Tax=unclassified Streptomyces TaxID=2593676 RepID=UPI0037ACC579
MGDFSGIDPAALKKMIASFDGDRTHLRDRVSYWKGQFAQWGMDTQPFGELLGICGWLDDESPKLKRRENLAAAMDAGAGPGTHMVQIPEPVAETSAQAQADGKKLALEFNANHGGDSKAGDQYHALAQELLAHQDDPDFCSAFYANLTPSEASTLPSLLAATNSSTAGSDLVVFSHALATATDATYPAPGFDKVVSYYTEPQPNAPDGAAWNRAAMLQYGTFPSDFLAKATKANGLDRFAENPQRPPLGDSFTAQALGLPQDTVTLDLQALGSNEDATQQAFATMGQGPGKTDLNGNLKTLAGYAADRHDPRLTAAFQTTLNAGAGNRSTQGPYGSYYAPVLHTGAETTFATAAMSALTGAHAKQSDYQDFITTTFTTFGAPAGATPQQTGDQAASLLRLAESADPSWPATRPAIASVADQAEAGKNDTGFMQGYYGNGGADLEAQLALELHAMDGTHGGTVLSPDSTRILGKFGDNLAAATTLNAKGDLPQFGATAFTSPQDMWAASMLLKYGPPGSQWDHTFLTSMGDAALHWRAAQKDNLRPGFSSGDMSLGLVDSWVDPKDPWYGELGLSEHNANQNIDQQTAIAQGIAANDPSLAVLSRLSDNQQASRDLLAGPDAKENRFVAEQLVNSNWTTPGIGDDSMFPSRVILQATQRGSGDKAVDTAAATAASNVFQAGANEYAHGKKPLPKTLGVALADVAGAYVPDFADSAPNGSTTTDPGFNVFVNHDGQPEIETDPSAMNQLFHSFMNDNPEAAGSFKAAVHANMTNVVRIYHGAGPDAIDDPRARAYLTNLGWLDGAIDNTTSDLKYKPAQKADEQANHDAMYAWIAGGVMSPFIAAPDGAGALVTGVYKGLSVVNGGGSAWLSYQFSTTHASDVADATQKRDLAEDKYLSVPVVNGLLASGQIKEKPEGYSWYHDGKVTLRTSEDWTQFDMWTKSKLTDQQRSLLRNLTSDSSAGYDDGTMWRTPSTAAVE